MENQNKTRAELVAQHYKNTLEIESLKKQNEDIYKESCLLSDENQWYTEELITRGRGKRKEEVFVGRIHWKEYFTDEDTGQKIEIKRSNVVREN